MKRTTGSAWLTCLLAALLCAAAARADAASPPQAGPNAEVAARAVRIAWLGSSDNAAHAQARAAFAGISNSLPGGAVFIDNATTAEKMPEAVLSLLRDQPDVLIVTGLPALLAVSAVDSGAIPVVALSPEATPDALRFSARKGGLPPNFHLFPLEYWTARLKALRAATGFSRLGYILPPQQNNAAQDALGSLLGTVANKVGDDGGEVFSVQLSRVDEASCREAVDDLFFDEIDALLLDASGCFAPQQRGREELLELLRQRGILPLSLTDADAVHYGALLAPWQGDNARLGRMRAAALQACSENGTDFALCNGASTTASALLEKLAAQTLYALNLDIAKAMGFNPTAALLAMVRAFFPSAPVPAGQSF
ncbi:hypothetical protein FACS189488_09310 [Betaproteobacteria bacterium]|nr:hypothetical protein FACS189488_09310 [Betaproteobacteria bacterium]